MSSHFGVLALKGPKCDSASQVKYDGDLFESVSFEFCVLVHEIPRVLHPNTLRSDLGNGNAEQNAKFRRFFSVTQYTFNLLWAIFEQSATPIPIGNEPRNMCLIYMAMGSGLRNSYLRYPVICPFYRHCSTRVSATFH
jgi:hypothetical protein